MERLGDQPAEGPSNQQAATCMGNSEKSWTKFYDKHASLRDTQAAAIASLDWRNAMLKSGLQKIAAQHEGAEYILD